MSVRIMIADDHGVFRSGLRALLEAEAGFEVVKETSTGPETVEAMATTDVDVLLLDISMPGMSGGKVAQMVLERKPDTAIVVLTMHEDAQYAQELLNTGAQAFVLKKSSGVELIQAIHAVLEGRRYVDPLLAGELLVPASRGQAGGPRAGLALLTPREKEVCTLLAYGHTNGQIAEQLSISQRTVESHRRSIMGKLEGESRADLVRFAIEHHLLEIP